MIDKPKCEALPIGASVIFILLWGGFIALCYPSYHSGTYDYLVTSEMAQTQVTTALERPMTGPLKDLKFSNAKVWFADDKVYVQAHVEGVVQKLLVRRHVQADVFAVGKPNYHDGGFYFVPTEAIRFENAKVKRVSGGAFDHTKDMVKQHLGEFVDEHGWGDALQEFKSEFEKWSRDTAQIVLATALTKHPFYTLKNDLKGFELKAVLEKVQVVDNVLHITLSLAQLTKSIFWALLCMVVAVIFTIAMFANPGMLMILPFMD